MDTRARRLSVADRREPEGYIATLCSRQTVDPARPGRPMLGLLEGLGCEQVRTTAQDMLDPAAVLPSEAGVLNTWLRHILSDSSPARQQWSALAVPPRLAGDEYVAAFWQRLVADGSRDEESLRRHAEREWSPWSHYERSLFTWSLSRFDLPAARGVFPRA